MSAKREGVVSPDRGNPLSGEPVPAWDRRSEPSVPTICPQCEVVFQHGKWMWSKNIPDYACYDLCPACQCSRDDAPHGVLTLSGDFFVENRDDIMRLVHATVEAQMAKHPMKRLMHVEDVSYGVVLSFTDMQLPCAVEEAIEYAYDGNADSFYIEESDVMRVYWRR